MSDHQTIWLKPWCDECKKNHYRHDEGQTWCQDNVYDPCEECGAMPVKYVMASDQPQKPAVESGG